MYVLKSTIDGMRYSIGLTHDVAVRLNAHNDGICPHGRQYRPWRLHVHIEFADEEHAVAFEKYLKIWIWSRVREASFRLKSHASAQRTFPPDGGRLETGR